MTELEQALIETLLVGLLVIVPFWEIFKKAGFHPALSLIIFVPAIGYFVVLLILGLGTWRTIEGE